jgi:Protein of unknown function (DUF4242)
MPLYLIERRYADQLYPNSDDVRLVEDVNAEEGVQWLFSFLTADRMQTYCLYEAPAPDALRAAARRANLPADVIVEVNRVTADTFR